MKNSGGPLETIWQALDPVYRLNERAAPQALSVIWAGITGRAFPADIAPDVYQEVLEVVSDVAGIDSSLRTRFVSRLSEKLSPALPCAHDAGPSFH